ncbi:MAG: undecaprenyl-diphosphate phosphatase [Gammaproteobacteria bacterium]|nr:undecaprenyl-diphosphate phosphatase [Gammaproteobacteria bacterium]
MNTLQILILAIVQGAAELLPVSSSAHVIVAEKLMGLDPTTPAMTLLLVMLHTGTMFAVIAYFWRSWGETYFKSAAERRTNLIRIIAATIATGIVGLTLLYLIKHMVANGDPHFEIEQLFGNSKLMATALAAAGVLIIFSSRIKEKSNGELSLKSSTLIGAVQGLCLPFRGFSRSGATISTGLVLGVSRRRAEEFSFALAVVLTPAVIVKEMYRLVMHQDISSTESFSGLVHMVAPGLLGMVFSFIAGLTALRWLSNWLESGRWYLFGGYCLIASMIVLWIG